MFKDLKDLFAAFAMIALLQKTTTAIHNVKNHNSEHSKSNLNSFDAIAHTAYDIADAMIKENNLRNSISDKIEESQVAPDLPVSPPSSNLPLQTAFEAPEVCTKGSNQAAFEMLKTLEALEVYNRGSNNE